MFLILYWQIKNKIFYENLFATLATWWKSSESSSSNDTKNLKTCVCKSYHNLRLHLKLLQELQDNDFLFLVEIVAFPENRLLAVSEFLEQTVEKEELEPAELENVEPEVEFLRWGPLDEVEEALDDVEVA